MTTKPDEHLTSDPAATRGEGVKAKRPPPPPPDEGDDIGGWTTEPPHDPDVSAAMAAAISELPGDAPPDAFPVSPPKEAQSQTATTPTPQNKKKAAAGFAVGGVTSAQAAGISAAEAAAASQRAVAMFAEGASTNWSLLVGAVVLALGFHAVVGAGTASLAVPKTMDERVEMFVYEPPPPPPPPEPEIEKPPEPEPEKPKPKIKQPKAKKDVPIEPPPDEPPPSNSDPEPTDDEPPPLVTGISMESTVKGSSGFKVRVGNTTYGDVNKEKFTDPNAVKKYRGGKKGKKVKVARKASVTSQPVVIKKSVPRYPKQLKDEGIEGVVVLKILIDEKGRVRGTKVIKGVHPVLDALARKALKKTLFTPAKVDGKPVKHTMTYRFRWEITD